MATENGEEIRLNYNGDFFKKDLRKECVTSTTSNYKYDREKTYTTINWGMMLLFGAILLTSILLECPWISLICLVIKGSVTSERVEKEKNF